MSSFLDGQAPEEMHLDSRRPDMYLQSSPVSNSDSRHSELDADLVSVIAGLLDLNEQDVIEQSDLTFIELGGDSVKALELTFRLDALGKSILLDDILEEDSKISLLPSLITSSSTKDPATDSDTNLEDHSPLPIQSSRSFLETYHVRSGQTHDAILLEAVRQIGCTPDQIESIAPLTAQQQGLWTGSLQQPGSYITHWRYRLPDWTDLDRLAEAWWKVLCSTPMLRTRMILSTEDDLFQVVVSADLYEHLRHFPSNTSNRDIVTSHGAALFDLHFVSVHGHKALQISAHHSIYDRMSMRLILSDVRKCYPNGDDLNARPSYLPLLQELPEEEHRNLLSQWRIMLGDESFTSAPRLQRPRKSPKTTAFIEKTARLGEKLIATKAELLAAAWSLVCSRHCGGDDVSFGLTVSRRDMSLAQVSEMAFPTFTTVPFCSRFSPGETVKAFLTKIRSTFKRIRSAQRAETDMIASISTNARKTCQFNSILVIQISTNASVEGQIQLFEPRDMLSQESIQSNPLLLECTVERESLHLKLAYDPEYMPTQTAEALLSQTCITCTQISSSTDTVLDDISIFSESDQRQISNWTRKCAPRKEMTLPALVQAQAIQLPNKQAIWQTERSVTYAELLSMMQAISKLIPPVESAHDEDQPRHFGICFDKTALAVATMLAVSSAGHAYVPLDPSNPEIRLQKIVEDSQVGTIFCSSDLAPRFHKITTPVVIVEYDKVVRMATRAESVISNRAKPTGTAYLLYTSGSTGQPKGVVITHSALCTALFAISERLKHKAAGRTLQFGSFAFDISVYEVWATLAFGGTICMPTDNERLDLDLFIRQSACSHAMLTPAVASTLSRESMKQLKSLAVGGESPSRMLYAAAHDAQIDLCNVFGPTEACILFLAADLKDEEQSPTNIGYSVSGTAWILDANNPHRLAPVGCVGELACSGHNLAAGYYHDLQKTEKAFINKPKWSSNFPDQTVDRVYRTGDLARYNADGSIEFLGRVGTYAKLAGNRFDLAEVESILDKHCDLPNPSVHICQFGTHRTDPQDILICFYASVVRQANQCALIPIDDEHETKHKETMLLLRDLLPSYMIPSAFLQVDHLPLNVSGKLDAKLLKKLATNLGTEELLQTSNNKTANIDDLDPNDPRSQASTHEASDLDSTNDTLLQLREEWTRVLGLTTLSLVAHNNFFDLGGNSLKAMHLASAMRRRGINLFAADVFLHPTLRTMASFLNDVVMSSSLKQSMAGSIMTPDAFELLNDVVLSPALAGKDASSPSAQRRNDYFGHL